MELKEKLEKGYIQSRVIIEVIGKPKEHIENSMKEFIEKIKSADDVEILKQDISPAKEVKEGDTPDLWGTFAELEILTKNISVLVNFCFDYMPSSVEITEPKELKLMDSTLSGILNDLQGRLHHVDLVAKQLTNQNQFLRENVNALIKNLVSLLLSTSDLGIEEISKFTGIEKANLEKFLDMMIKENLIKKEGDKYSLVNNAKREK